MKMTREELLRKLSESDNVDLMEDIKDSWVDIEPDTTEIDNLKAENEKLQNEYNDLKTKYKERFFTDEPIKKEKKEEIGLHEEEVFKIENIFKEV